MSYNIRSKIVKVRKLHKCFGCLSTINIGEKAEINTNVFDGSIYNIYFCLRCLKYQKTYCSKCKNTCEDLSMDGFPEGYIRECDNEEREDKKNV